MNIIVGKKLTRSARVLGGNKIGFAEYPKRAKRNVFEVSDRRAYNLQAGERGWDFGVFLFDGHGLRS